MQKQIYCVLFLILCSFSCSEVTYRTLYQSQTDPVFIFPKAPSIGLCPMYWTKAAKQAGTDELFEKVLLGYAKKELELRGANVFYIPLENLKEEEDGNATLINMEKYPDLVLTVFYFQRSGQVNIPTQTAAVLGKQGGALSSRGAHSVTAYDLDISCGLWSGLPQFKKIEWRAEILKGSPIPNLSEQAPSMIHSLFLKKFLRN